MLAPAEVVAIEPARTDPPRAIGRYVLFREVAHGGMATVHLGRLRGVGGFARTVAIKRLLPSFARDPEFVAMFLDEGRLAARIKHPNVVPVMDILASEGELFLVMEYVHGEGFSKLLRRARALGIPVPQEIAIAIMVDVLYGLHAAHETCDERGESLGIVHRDVSPQNMIVGVDGVARVLDFGIAKAAQRAHGETRAGELKGKLGYMAPEQVTGSVVDRRADVYAAGVTLWEALAGERMFAPLDFPQLINEILKKEHVAPSRLAPGTSAELDAVVLCALERDPRHRYATAGDMAADLERIGRLPSRREIGEWVALVADAPLRKRSAVITEIENTALVESRPPARRAWLAASAVLGIAALLGMAGGREARWLPLGAASARAPGGALAASSAASAAASTPEAAPSVDVPACVAPAEASSSTVGADRPASASRPWWAPPQTWAPAGKPQPRRGSDDCSPPYWVDSDGVRIPKRWCS
jgi:serine/threonine-protein kinase